MNHFIRNILIVIFLMSPICAFADEWDKYLEFAGRFYNLDKQEFKSISCNVDVPITRNQIKQLHAQFDPMKDKLVFTENLTDFTLTYKKNSGLSINRPSLNLKMISEEGMTDPEKVKKGIEMVREGFKQQIDGASMQLQGLFEEYQAPKKSQYRIKEIKGDKAGYTVKYEKDEGDFTEVFSNKQRTIKQVSKNDEVSSVQNYKAIGNNKLILNDAQAVIKSAMGTMEVNMTVSYEEVGHIVFPTHIEGHFKQTVQTLKQEVDFDIYLRNCRAQ